MLLTWTKRILALAAVILVVIATVYALMPQPVPVDIATVDRGEVEVTIDEDAVTRVRDVFEVSAPITGKLERLSLDVGDLVKKGEKIAVVRPVDPPIRDARTRRELEAALRAARAGVLLGQAQVTRAKAAVRFSTLDLERYKALAGKQIVSERVLQQHQLELDTRTAQLRQAEASLELRKRELETAEARILEPNAALQTDDTQQCCVEVLAPAGGSVLKLLTESEQVVRAGTKLLEIGDRADIEIVADLLSEDAVKAKVGDLVWVENWGGEKRLAAKIRRIDPSGFMKVSALGIEEQRVNAIIDITGPRSDWERLGHDFRVYVRIVIWRDEKALRVPIAALFRKGADWSVYKVDDGRAVRQRVEISRRNATHAVVGGGLSEGDEVILHPSDRISDGAAVVRRSDEAL